MPLSDLWEDNPAPNEPENEDVALKKSDAEQLRQLKGRARTEKARQKALLNKLRRKLGSQSTTSSTAAGSSSVHSSAACGSAPSVEGKDGEAEDSKNWAQRIQESCFTPRLFSTLLAADPYGQADYKKAAVERGRAVMSLLLKVVQTLLSLLSPVNASAEDSVQAVLNVCVLDDTSTRLKGTAKVDRTNVVHGVMNTIQTVHILYKPSDHEQKQNAAACHSFLVPTPLYCLPSQKTHDLYAAYSAYMLLSSAGVGHCLRALQCPERICETVRWKVHVVVGDALPTNDAMFKLERRILVDRKEDRRLAFRQKCILHALCLVRRPAVLSVEGFWTTLVRLAHLFEQQSFKKKFSMAMVQVLSKPGSFVRNFSEFGGLGFGLFRIRVHD